jgi:murein DD-endopeptidase MepM/ murein hydrolase activator NlpD
MQISNLQNLVRLVLVASLFFYLSGIPFFHVSEAAAQNIPAEEAEDGMGGGINPAEMEMDLELSGIFESEDFSRPQMLIFSSYTLERGDIIGNIAVRTGLTEDTLISVNHIRNTRLMQIGQAIRIPNQDGIFYTVRAGDTLESIAESHGTTVCHIKTVNELFSENIAHNISLFIPGARMNWVERQEINGDLFIWPVIGRISSGYGFRRCPFSGVRQFHTGIDISAPTGTSVRAAMSGRVTHVGYDDIFGNTVVITHHSGYRTLYAHLNVARVRTGAFVQTGERIGDVGSTGLSTGPHLHFTVYRHGVTVNPRSLMR